jgi:1-deoxy-D-xylulose-5-phosphate reductoisomerase
VVSIVVLGSTGSIGCSALNVIAQHPERFSVHGLVAHTNIRRLCEQAGAFLPDWLAVTDPEALLRWHADGWHEHAARAYRQAGRAPPELVSTPAVAALCGAVQTDVVVAAIVGAAGLAPTLAAVQAGKRVLLANKESLVLAGAVMMAAAEASGALLLPVDSEHNAIFQSLPDGYDRTRAAEAGIAAIWLTASGGPFLNTPLDEFAHISPAQAVAHPNWSMGRKISVDSATMANKGLELIEAAWLFGLPVETFQVVVHPQSVVHSLVEYRDGSFLAQLGEPDMRTPIAYCLGYPERLASGVRRLRLTELAQLTFQAPDFERFPALRLAFDVLRAGGTAAATFNAANEIAVQAFLEEKISFTGIVEVIDSVLQSTDVSPVSSLDVALEADRQARSLAGRLCGLAASIS